MTLEGFYREVGGSYAEVIERIPSEDMVRKFVLRFAEDTTYADWKKAVEEEDVVVAFRATHTMKGIASNLGFARLMRASEELTEALRPGDCMGSEAQNEAFVCAYREVMEAIKKLD